MRARERTHSTARNITHTRTFARTFARTHVRTHSHARTFARTFAHTFARTHAHTHSRSDRRAFGLTDGRTDRRIDARSLPPTLACLHASASAPLRRTIICAVVFDVMSVCDATFHEIDHGRAWRPLSSSFNGYLRPSREHGRVMGDVAKI
jgi:hypothetical protein